MTWVPTLLQIQRKVPLIYGCYMASLMMMGKVYQAFLLWRVMQKVLHWHWKWWKKKRITRTWKHIDETSRKLKCLNAWDHHHLIRCKFMVLFVIEESHISRIVLHSISIWLALPMEYPTKHGSLSLSLFSEFLFHDKTHFIKRIEKWYYDLIYL